MNILRVKTVSRAEIVRQRWLAPQPQTARPTKHIFWATLIGLTEETAGLTVQNLSSTSSFLSDKSSFLIVTIGPHIAAKTVRGRPTNPQDSLGVRQTLGKKPAHLFYYLFF